MEKFMEFELTYFRHVSPFTLKGRSLTMKIRLCKVEDKELIELYGDWERDYGFFSRLEMKMQKITGKEYRLSGYKHSYNSSIAAVKK